MYNIILVILLWCLQSSLYVNAIDCVYCEDDSVHMSQDTFKKYQFSKCTFVFNRNKEKCKIKSIDKDTFKNMNGLIDIWINSTGIEYLDKTTFRDTWNLQELLLYSNKLATIENGLFSNLSHLTCLSISNNKLQSIDASAFTDLKSLEELYMYSNMLVQIDEDQFRYNTELKILSLYNNSFTNVPVGLFKHNCKLSELYLNGNKIKYIQDGLLSHLTLLKDLYLYGNSIQYISKNAFPVTSTLVYIDISENQLEYIDPNLFKKLTSLVEFYFDGNPWFCDCKLKEAHLFYKKYRAYDAPVCNNPIALRNRTWNSLSTTEFQCFAIVSHQVHHKNNIMFSCAIEADSNVTVTWYYNNTLLDEAIPIPRNQNYETTDVDFGNGTIVYYLTIPVTTLNATESYSCHAVNKYGSAQIIFDNIFNNYEPRSYVSLGLFIAIISVVFVIAIIAFVKWMRIKCKKSNQDQLLMQHIHTS